MGAAYRAPASKGDDGRRGTTDIAALPLERIGEHHTDPIAITSQGAPINRPSLRQRDWEALARDYGANELPVPELCAIYGIGRTALYNHIKARGWPLRRGLGYQAKRKPRREENLAQRLLTALDEQMTQFESRRATDDAHTTADSERDARTLTSLVRLFDKLKSLGEKQACRRKAATPAAPKGKAAHDADRLRQELAQRLEKLRVGLGS